MPEGSNINADVEAVKRAADAQRLAPRGEPLHGEFRPATDLPSDPLPGEICLCPDLATIAPDCPQHGTSATTEVRDGSTGFVRSVADIEALRARICTCPGDPSASAAGWNASCPEHGETAVQELFGMTTDELAAEALAGYPIKIQRGGLRFPAAPGLVAGWGTDPIGYTSEVGEETVGEDHDTTWFCDTAKSLIGGDGQRRQDYGSVEESFERIAVLWSVVIGHTVTAEQVALCMVQLKLARLFVSPGHTDSYVDIIGYAALGGQIAHQPGRHRKPE